MLDAFANLLNRVNDWDLTWAGFRKLRPASDQRMSIGVVAVFCAVYCPLCAALAVMITWLILRERGPGYLPWLLAGAAAGTFIVLQSLLAWAWNRRARKSRQ
jgi:fatty acid desaturase